MPTATVRVLPAILLLFLTSVASAQGVFVNLETPQVKPIAVATLNAGAGPFDVLLVCNTPDNSVELYHAAPPHAFIRRVPVGLGPVTVRWNPALGRFYTCNFDGDSVSIVQLSATLSGGQPVVEAWLARTQWVGDEPSDVGFDPTNTFVLITLSSSSGMALKMAADLAEVVPYARAKPASDPRALKLPRSLALLPDGRRFILNFMSDDFVPNYLVNEPPDPFGYDADLMVDDPGLPSPTTRILGGLGSTHHGMAFTSDRTRLFVVGTRAKNLVAGELAVAAQDFGFVESCLFVLDAPPGMPPAVRAELPLTGGTPAPLYHSVNLNVDPTSVQNPPRVGPADALSQPTDVVLLEGTTPSNAPQKVFVAAFHSDKVGVLVPDASKKTGWSLGRIAIPPIQPTPGYGMVGPRGLALSSLAVDPATPGQPGLLFVLNRLDNSVAVINPHTDALSSVNPRFRLQHDPTPDPIRKGRKFLYSAALSGTGFVSCASCHVDARTDGIIWDLSNTNESVPIPPHLNDAHGIVPAPTVFPQPKLIMVTQTLQGLVNYPVVHASNLDGQILFTNAPYHWRGDRPDFQSFAGAFVSLLGRAQPLTAAEMDEYTAFINTIMHPPNPNQLLDRQVSGTLGANPDDPLAAAGAKLGLQLAHNAVTFLGGRSCVDCHALPEGSNNQLTLPTLTAGLIVGPMETAAFRNVFQREAALHDGFGGVVAARTSSFGLTHAGDFGAAASINRFLATFFTTSMPGPTDFDRGVQIKAVVELLRELDTGIAPAAGFAYTVDFTNPALDGVVFAILEGQVAEANIGLAVYHRSGTLEEGYWFDVTASPPGYRREGTATVLSRAQLLAQVSEDGFLVLQGTPAGSERRVASLSGQPTPISDPLNPPANVTLEPMAPRTHWVDVMKFTGNIPAVARSPSQQTRYDLTDALVNAAGSFGIATRQKHQAPRVLRVAGDHIRNGALLLLGLPRTAPAQNPQYLVLPLYPTARQSSQGRRIWETAVEVDAFWSLALLNGGPFAPGVLEVLLHLPPSQPLDPDTWNGFEVNVLNEDMTSNGFPSGSWQVLKVQDVR